MLDWVNSLVARRNAVYEMARNPGAECLPFEDLRAVLKSVAAAKTPMFPAQGASTSGVYLVILI